MLSDIIQEVFGFSNAARNISRLDLNLNGYFVKQKQGKVGIGLLFVFSDKNINLDKVIGNYSPNISQFSW